MKNWFSIIAVLLLLVTAGCLNTIAGANDYANEYLSTMDYVSAANPYDTCKVGACNCFVCKNGTALLYITTSLAGGHCYFQSECDEDTYQSFVDPTSGEEYAMRYFMLGAGPSFADFGEANRYCNNGLTMAVHWLLGDENKAYDNPDAGRAMCMLFNGVMPVYVLYTGSENIDVERTAEIAREFGDVTSITYGHLTGPAGPVVITTEFEYNASRPGVVDAVVEQIRVINQECNDYTTDPPQVNCFVAVAPKMGDMEGLDAVMSRVDRKQVHLLAYGINSHYDKSGTCSGSRMVQDAASFSRYGLYTYGLPTVIPYVLFDPNTPDATGNCIWTDYGFQNSVEEGYANFFMTGIETLSGVGVIGIAPYDFNSSSAGADPLKCNNCALGANEERMASWFGGCQKMINISTKQPSGRMPLIFPNESGGYCDFGANMDANAHMFRDSQGQEFWTTSTFKMDPPANEAYFRCDACILEGTKKASGYFPVLKTGTYNDQPFIPTGFPAHVAEICPECQEPATCYIYPEIDYFSSRFSIDPMLLRAIIWKESSFNQCSAAKVCRPGVSTSEGCLKGDYAAGYNEMHDPDGECEEHLLDITAPDYDPGSAGPEAPEQRPKWRFAGLGLLQVMESPYIYWPAEYSPTGEDGEYTWEFERARYSIANPDGRRGNIEGAMECSPYFNPFNTSHATCMGAKKLHGTFNRGREWTDETNNKWSKCRDLFSLGTDTSKRDILAAFYAIYALTGIMSEGYDPYYPGSNPLDGWAKDYCDIKAGNEDCVRLTSTGSCITGCVDGDDGDDPDDCVLDPDIHLCSDQAGDFMSYVYCLIPEHGISDKLSVYAGFRKLGAYEYLQEECPNSYCPTIEKTLEKAGIDPDDTERVNPDLDLEDPYSILGEGE